MKLGGGVLIADSLVAQTTQDSKGSDSRKEEEELGGAQPTLYQGMSLFSFFKLQRWS